MEPSIPLKIILWQVTHIPNLAIIFSILADALASFPTIVKSYNHPETETLSAYFIGIINSTLTLLVIKTWNFENYAFQAYWLAISVIFVILLSRRYWPKYNHNIKTHKNVLYLHN